MIKRKFHLPTRIQWNIKPTAEESVRLQQVITEAIRRTMENIISGEVNLP